MAVQPTTLSPSTDTRRRTPARRSFAPSTAAWIQSAFLIVMALISLVPLLAIFVGTFQDGNEVIRRGMTFDVDLGSLSLDNYVLLFTDSGPYFRWFANTLLLTIGQVAGTLLVSSFVAYGFAMYEFRTKTLWFIMVLLVMTVPFEMLMLPLYVQVNDMGLADTYTVIALPFLAAAVTIFFFRLVLPITKPAMAAMAILNGRLCWNNFLWPLLVLRSPEKFTLPIGLNTLLTPYGNNYELLIIGAFFSLIPILILFLAFQRFFIEGITAGAVKG